MRLSRAAWFVFGASLATGVAAGAPGCGGDVTTEPRSAGGSEDGQGGSGAATGAGGATGSTGGEGGAPDDPPDAGMDAPDDDGGRVDLYGAPPPPDGGGAGGGEPVYGAPPPRE